MASVSLVDAGTDYSESLSLQRSVLNSVCFIAITPRLPNTQCIAHVLYLALILRTIADQGSSVFVPGLACRACMHAGR